MAGKIDCLFIGHNEMDFTEYEENIRKMGITSGAYRDLDKNFIVYDQKPYPVSEMFNLFYCGDRSAKESRHPLRMGETFSAAIAYLGTYLERRGFNFDFVNSFREEKERLAEMLRQDDILTIAVITTLYVFTLPIIEVVDFIKSCNQTVKIIVGGPFVTTQARTLSEEELFFLFKSIGADIYVNSYQGELALVDIIRALKSGTPLRQINNIYYQDGGEYIYTHPLPENNRLEENMVNWDLFDGRIDRYVNLRTSISCPFSCAFCGFPQHAGKYQPAGVEFIEQELNKLDRLNSVKGVYFIDDTFNVPVQRFKQLLRMMVRNKYRFRWHCNFRCQFVDREMVELMKESGCLGVFLGIESGNNQILENMNKTATREKYLEGISMLREYEILTHGNFIIGFPGETAATVDDTRSFIEESGLDFYRVQLWYCEIITPIWKQRAKYDIQGSQFEWSHVTMDSKTASDYVDEIFLKVRKAIWVPQYNFEFAHLIHLLHRGIPVEKVKKFLRAFSLGIREKLSASSYREVSFEVVKQLKRSLQTDRPASEIWEIKEDVGEKYDAEFVF